MKRQIADFLGELAEEMGYAPEPDPSVPTHIIAPPPMADRNSRQDAEIRAEVTRLRGTVDHLSAEITNLRAEVARLRHMPPPPDSAVTASPIAVAPLSRRSSEDDSSPLSMFPSEPDSPLSASR